MNRYYPVALTLALVVGCAETGDGFAVGTLERDRIELSADSNEPIIAINVTEGDRVVAGSALLVQDGARPQALLARAQAERNLALARLSKAETGPRAQAIERARARLSGAESNIATVQRELERQESLIRQDYASQSRVNLLKGELQEATARRDEVNAELDELLEGTRSEEIEEARALLGASSATVTDLEIDVERTTIRAPVGGIIEALPVELGERPLPGQVAVALLADGRSYARVYISQPLRTRLAPGMPATIRVDGYDSDFPATIRWISSEAAFTPYFALTQHDRSRLSYLAEIDLDSAPDTSALDLPAGIPVEARFPGIEP